MIKVTDRLKDGRLTSLVFDSKLNNSKDALTDEEVTMTIRTVDLLLRYPISLLSWLYLAIEKTFLLFPQAHIKYLMVNSKACLIRMLNNYHAKQKPAFRR